MSKRVDLDIRPNPNSMFSNFDYGGPENGGKTGPGRGLYNGMMDKYKSVTDFLNKARKRRKLRRKKALQLMEIACLGN